MDILCSPFTCKKNRFCLILTKMNTQFVINKPVTKVFKVFIESFFNLHDVLLKVELMLQLVAYR